MSEAVLPARRPVSSIDLWKTAALAIILIDHLGFFIFPDQGWMTAIGRSALPIFFFLIGFARTRQVPWFWWVAGILLTALDVWRVGDWREIDINILINFALIRLCLPVIERHVITHWWRAALLAIGLAAMIPLAAPWIEYGTEGMLLALVGLAHRRALDAGPDRGREPLWLLRRGLGAFATLAFMAAQVAAYGFPVTETWIMAACVIAVSALLLRFRSGDARWQPGGFPAMLAGLCGRRSLEIYITQIVGLVLLGRLLEIDAADIAGDEDEGDEE